MVLRRLLTLSATAPLTGAFWLAGKIHEAADREVNDPVQIRQALRQLERDLEAGIIDEPKFEKLEEELLAHLQQVLEAR